MKIGTIPASEDYGDISVETVSFGVDDKRDYVTLFSDIDDCVNVGVRYEDIDELITLLNAAKIAIERELQDL